MTVTWNGASVLAKVQAAAGRGIERGAEAVKEEAVRLIMTGPKTGELYTWVGTTKNDPAKSFLVRAPQGHKFWAKLRSTPHQSSAPDEAPANDFGGLVASISSSFDLASLKGSVSASGLIPGWLEYGTRYMEPRPFMRPAAANKVKDIRQDVAAEIGKALNGAAPAMLMAAE